MSFRAIQFFFFFQFAAKSSIPIRKRSSWRVTAAALDYVDGVHSPGAATKTLPPDFSEPTKNRNMLWTGRTQLDVAEGPN